VPLNINDVVDGVARLVRSDMVIRNVLMTPDLTQSLPNKTNLNRSASGCIAVTFCNVATLTCLTSPSARGTTIAPPVDSPNRVR
jgi:hypothetical protein